MDRPRDQLVKIIGSAALLQDPHVIESSLSAHLSLKRLSHERWVRSGKPSINATYGSKNAVMLGDILYSKAYFELSKFEGRIAAALSGAVTKLAVGELMDVSLSNDFNDDAGKYLQMIYLKTSALIEEVARCGAFLKFGGAENRGEIPRRKSSQIRRGNIAGKPIAKTNTARRAVQIGKCAPGYQAPTSLKFGFS